MTPNQTRTRRPDGGAGNGRRGGDYARRQAEIRARDLYNTWACAPDGSRLRREIDRAFSACLSRVYSDSEDDGAAEMWTDGSFDAETGRAGIGVVISDGGAESGFGKAVRVKSARDAEVYALAVGLSYLLDTGTGARTVRVRYDSTSAAACAAELDAWARDGSPYTNFRSAMRRARKAGVSVIFEHVRGHGADGRNNACDAIARYYAKRPLDGRAMQAVERYVGSRKDGRRKGGRQ